METILIVDDDQVYLDLLKLNLESYGYRVLTGGSAGEGWARLECERVDLVVLDVAMPVEDGHCLAGRLRADHRLSPIPVIFLSGLAGPAEQAKAFENGADDFLAKPVSPADLVMHVRSHLRRRAWQRRIDDGLARIQDVERTRDDLLGVIVRELGGIAAALESELRRSLEPGRISGDGADDVQAALRHVHEIAAVVAGVRSRYGWRPVAGVEVGVSTGSASGRRA